MLKILHRKTNDPHKIDANWQAIELWANRQIKVVSFSFPTSTTGITTGVPSPYPLEIIAFHVLVPGTTTGSSTFDLLVNGTSILPTALVVPLGANVFSRAILQRPKGIVSIDAVIQSRASAPDMLQAEMTVAGAGLTTAYCGAEFK